MENGFRLKTRLPAAPETVYRAWLSSDEHSAMTGGRATATGTPGGSFTAWDGYIRGRNLELKPHWCIVQAWRTTKFAESDPDSRLELCIHPSDEGCEFILIHTGIPPDQVADYQTGWVEHYFEPMKAYFAARPARRRAKRRTARRPAGRKAGKLTGKKTSGKKRTSKKTSKKKSARRRARR